MDYTQRKKVRKLADKYALVEEALHFYADHDSTVDRLLDIVQQNLDFFGDPPAGTKKLPYLADWLEQKIVESKEEKILLAMCNCDRCRHLRGEK